MTTKKVLVRNMFDRRRTPHLLLNDPVHVTKQEFKDEVNINTIVSKMKRGISPPPWMTSRTPRYGDFTTSPSTFMEAFETVARAEEAFQSLPLEFRRELDHDPRNLASAPRELYERFGLVNKPQQADSGSAASDAGVGQRVQGDSDLPGKAPSGAKNAGSKTGSKPDSEG